MSAVKPPVFQMIRHKGTSELQYLHSDLEQVLEHCRKIWPECVLLELPKESMMDSTEYDVTVKGFKVGHIRETKR